ncbi:MAG: type II secretion system F family protein [Kiritimatiellia bacterium]|jgi:type IV pilus assembly protein PilC|nr:type II secretion system F family protein [Kiritimatiellia bacterium]
MPKYRYVAMDSKGSETDGVLDAENQSQAIALIRSKGFFPTRVVPVDGSKGAGSKHTKGVGEAKGGLSMEIRLPRFLRGRVRPKQLMTFTRQLATLVEAGLPLLRGLRILLKQEKNVLLREAVNGMGEAVEGGSTFSEALGQYPGIFDNLFVNMVKAGEAGGVLEVVLARLAEFMEKAEKIKNKVKSAMIYPVVVMVAAIGILAFLLVFVIPRFEVIFRDLLGEGGLPPLTQFVIDVSNLVAHRWMYILGGIFVVVVLVKLWRRTEMGSYLLDKFKLRTPLFGGLFRKSAIARLSRTLGTLMNSGVPVLQALNIVRDTSGNEVIARAVQHVHDSVKEGETMALPLESSGEFPDMVVSMVDVGEETGALPDMLLRIADNYDDEVDTTVEGLTSIIEPVMIIFLAVIIGTIVIAMFIPLISIITEMSQ